MTNPLKGVVVAISILVFWTIVGVVGFVIIEGWSVLNSLYMTVITNNLDTTAVIHAKPGSGTLC